jgi:hypothetical protein
MRFFTTERVHVGGPTLNDAARPSAHDAMLRQRCSRFA